MNLSLYKLWQNVNLYQYKFIRRITHRHWVYLSNCKWVWVEADTFALLKKLKQSGKSAHMNGRRVIDLEQHSWGWK